MIRVSKVIVEQYSPYPSRWDQLHSGGDAPLHPISHIYRPNREHLDHPMMNKITVSTLCHKNMYNKYIYDDVAYKKQSTHLCRFLQLSLS